MNAFASIFFMKGALKRVELQKQFIIFARTNLVLQQKPSKLNSSYLFLFSFLSVLYCLCHEKNLLAEEY